MHFFFLIAPILFIYYELSVCPLILKYNKVYLAASLVAKPSLYARFEKKMAYSLQLEFSLILAFTVR